MVSWQEEAMSKFVKVKTQLREFNYIKQALEDLKLEWQENATYCHVWSGHSEVVPLVIQASGAKFALRATPEGVYEVIGDDMQMKGVRATLERIQQRYAYHMVREETARAGFELVDEQAGRDGVVRLTVRRWS
jgi:hypothetical protein